MASFTDTAGRRWTIVVNFATACRIEDESGIDVTRLFSEEHDDRARLAKPSHAFRALCAAVRDQLSDRGISDEEFGRNFDQDTCEAAISAMYEAVIDFFPNPRRDMIRGAFRRMVEATAVAKAKADAALADMIASANFAADLPAS